MSRNIYFLQSAGRFLNPDHSFHVCHGHVHEIFPALVQWTITSTYLWVCRMSVQNKGEMNGEGKSALFPVSLKWIELIVTPLSQSIKYYIELTFMALSKIGWELGANLESVTLSYQDWLLCNSSFLANLHLVLSEEEFTVQEKMPLSCLSSSAPTYAVAISLHPQLGKVLYTAGTWVAIAGGGTLIRL